MKVSFKMEVWEEFNLTDVPKEIQEAVQDKIANLEIETGNQLFDFVYSLPGQIELFWKINTDYAEYMDATDHYSTVAVEIDNEVVWDNQK